jgi:hypothetical protein
VRKIIFIVQLLSDSDVDLGVDLSYIDELLDSNLCYLYRNYEPILSASDMEELKMKVKLKQKRFGFLYGILIVSF